MYNIFTIPHVKQHRISIQYRVIYSNIITGKYMYLIIIYYSNDSPDMMNGISSYTFCRSF